VRRPYTPAKCRKCLGRDVGEEIGKYAGTLGAPTMYRPPISPGQDKEPDGSDQQQGTCQSNLGMR
jgi:hypothetical protein